MSKKAEKNRIFLRTFDLPDIHFASMDEPDEACNSIRLFRDPGGCGLDAEALSRWYEQSKGAKARRDCWLQVGSRIYVIWGAAIAEHVSGARERSELEQWKLSFDEMRRYRPSWN